VHALQFVALLARADAVVDVSVPALEVDEQLPLRQVRAMSTMGRPPCAMTSDSPNDAKSTSWPAALAAQAIGTSG
jgi:hypothetical protein